MKLPRVRFTVRRMMVAVAIMALAFELEPWSRRYTYCQSNAARCASAERFHLWMAESHRGMSVRYRRRAAEDEAGFLFHNEQAVLYTKAARGERAEAKRAADRGEGFRRAAMFPWVSIPPAEIDPIGSVPVDRDELPEISPLKHGREPDSGVRRFRGGT